MSYRNERLPEPCLCGDEACPRCFNQPYDDPYDREPEYDWEREFTEGDPYGDNYERD